ncbi:MAG: YncE family protein [Deltaproteobacteria bacterium]|nr:YncE family protein [Deltaproteobacteria bacterium]MCL5278023.1 YncE family protein [Deltaproteobacteria bacterium]
MFPNCVTLTGMKLMAVLLLSALLSGIAASCASSVGSSGLPARSLGSPGSGPAGNGPAAQQPLSYELSYPAATEQYVFVANTTNNTVAKIDKTTLSITSIPVGLMPTTVDITPDNHTAVVFNSGDYSVSLIDISTDTVTTVPVDIYDNTMVVSPSGNVAITYFDPSKSSGLSANPTRNFNEISIVDIVRGTSTLVNVGYLPYAIMFTPDGSKAIAVTTSLLSVIDLGNNYAVTRYQLVDPLQQQIVPSSLKLTADGRFALAVIQDSGDIVVQDITDGSRTVLTLGPTVTDIALTTDGSRAIAVNQGNGSLSYITLSTFSVTTRYTGLDINSIAVSNDGTDAMLYTNSPTTTTAAGETVYVLSFTDGSIQSYPVIKGVSSVIMAPFTTTVGVSSAIIVHNGPGGSSSDPVKQFFYDNYAVTLFDMDTGISTPVALVSKPSMFAVSSDGVYGYAMMPDTDAVAVFDLLTQLSTGVYVPSTPTFVGVMPGMHTAYVGETYPLGRLSFIEPDQGMVVSTITGFELKTD